MTQRCLCWALGTIVLAVLTASSVAAAGVRGQTIRDLSGSIPVRVLERSVSPKFYRSLLISPVEDWIVVRARVVNAHLSGARVIRSAVDPASDALALKLAGEFRLAGNYSIGQIGATDAVLLHLLIYQLADGMAALSFAHLDSPGGIQMKYWGCARLAVRKHGGDWEEIKGPLSLDGKGWAIRESGTRNNLKMNRIPQTVFYRKDPR
jgi:hypothetical protein